MAFSTSSTCLRSSTNGRATTGAAASSSSSTIWTGASSIGSGTLFWAGPRSISRMLRRSATIPCRCAGKCCLRLFAQEPTDHLSGGGERQVRAERDLARVLVRRQASPNEALDFSGERLGRAITLFEHDKGLDDFGADRVGLADGGGQRHGGVADQAILDLAGSDPITRRGDHVVVPSDEVDIALLV